MAPRFESFGDFCGRARRVELLVTDLNCLMDESFPLWPNKYQSFFRHLGLGLESDSEILKSYRKGAL
jgi:hypothetical protein